RVKVCPVFWPGFLFGPSPSNFKGFWAPSGVIRAQNAAEARSRIMNLRNVAIIAHVDHGKTTLVDRLLQQSGVYRYNERQVERAMDSNDLERERGITILAKAASVQWKDT